MRYKSGFRSLLKNHIGLKNVIERIEMKGHGYVKIDSVIGKGTIITIEFKEGE
jgi:signal transduction histidine kinase